MLRWWLLLAMSLAQALAAPNKLEKTVEYTNSSIETKESDGSKSSRSSMCVVDAENCDCFQVFPSSDPGVVFTRDRARTPPKDRLSVGAARNVECVQNVDACTCEWVETDTDPFDPIIDPVCVTDEENCACGWDLDLATLPRKNGKLGNTTKLTGDGAARSAVCLTDRTSCTCDWIEFDPLDPTTDPLPPVCVTDRDNCACGWDLDLTALPRKTGQLGNDTGKPDAPKADFALDCAVDDDSCSCAWTPLVPPRDPQCFADLEECVCGWEVADPTQKTRVEGGNSTRSAADSKQAPPRCLYDEASCTCAWSTPAPPVCIADTTRCTCEWAYPPRSLANDTSATSSANATKSLFPFVCEVDEENCECKVIPILPPAPRCVVDDVDCTCEWSTDSSLGPVDLTGSPRVDNVTRPDGKQVRPQRPCLSDLNTCTCAWGDVVDPPTPFCEIDREKCQCQLFWPERAGADVDAKNGSQDQGQDRQDRQSRETFCRVDEDTCSCEWVERPVQCFVDEENCNCGWQLLDGTLRTNIDIKVRYITLANRIDLLPVPDRRRCLVDRENCACSWVVDPEPEPACRVDKEECDCRWIFMGKSAGTDRHAAEDAKRASKADASRPIPECLVDTDTCTCAWAPPPGPQCIVDWEECSCFVALPRAGGESANYTRNTSASKQAQPAPRCLVDETTCTCAWQDPPPPPPPECVVDEVNCKCFLAYPPRSDTAPSGDANDTNTRSTFKQGRPIPQCVVNADACTCEWQLPPPPPPPPQCLIDEVNCRCSNGLSSDLDTSASSVPPADSKCVIDQETCTCKWQPPIKKCYIDATQCKCSFSWLPFPATTSPLFIPKGCNVDLNACICQWVKVPPLPKLTCIIDAPHCKCHFGFTTSPATSPLFIPKGCSIDQKKCICKWVKPPPLPKLTCIIDAPHCKCHFGFTTSPATSPLFIPKGCSIDQKKCICKWIPPPPPPPPQPQCFIDEVNCKCHFGYPPFPDTPSLLIKPIGKKCVVNKEACTCSWVSVVPKCVIDEVNCKCSFMFPPYPPISISPLEKPIGKKCIINQEKCTCNWVSVVPKCIIDEVNCKCGFAFPPYPAISTSPLVKPIDKKCIINKDTCTCSWVSIAPKCIIDEANCKCGFAFPPYPPISSPPFVKPIGKKCIINQETCTCNWVSIAPKCIIDEVNCKCGFAFPPYPAISTSPLVKPIDKKCIINKDTCTCNWVSIVPKCIIDEVNCKCGFAFPPYPTNTTSSLGIPIDKKCIINQEKCTCSWVSVPPPIPKCIIDAPHCKCSLQYPPYPVTTSPTAIPIGCSIDEKACLCKWVATTPNVADVLEKVRILLAVIADYLKQLEPAVRSLTVSPVAGLKDMRSEQREKLVEEPMAAIKKLGEMLARGDVSRLEKLEAEEAEELQSHLDGDAEYLKRLLQEPNYLIEELGQLASEKPRPIIEALTDTQEWLDDVFN